jgi:hypothetical protein
MNPEQLRILLLHYTVLVRSLVNVDLVVDRVHQHQILPPISLYKIRVSIGLASNEHAFESLPLTSPRRLCMRWKRSIKFNMERNEQCVPTHFGSDSKKLSSCLPDHYAFKN